MWIKFAVALIAELAEKASGPIANWLRERAAAKKLEDDKKAIRDAVAKIPPKP